MITVSSGHKKGGGGNARTSVHLQTYGNDVLRLYGWFGKYYCTCARSNNLEESVCAEGTGNTRQARRAAGLTT